MNLLLLVLVVLLLIAVLPGWPHTAGWNYGTAPRDALFVVLVVLLVLVLAGRL